MRRRKGSRRKNKKRKEDEAVAGLRNILITSRPQRRGEGSVSVASSSAMVVHWRHGGDGICGDVEPICGDVKNCATTVAAY